MFDKAHPRTIAIIVTGSLLLPACSSGGNPASPTNTVGGLPAVSNSGGTQRPKVNKLRLTGKITDAVTGEPIDKATIVVEAYEQAPSPSPAASVAPGTLPSAGAASPGASPAVGASALVSPAPGLVSPAASGSPSVGYTPPPPGLVSPVPGAASASPGGYLPKPMPTVQTQPPGAALPDRGLRTASTNLTRVAMEEVPENLPSASPPESLEASPSTAPVKPRSKASAGPEGGRKAISTKGSASPDTDASASPATAKKPSAQPSALSLTPDETSASVAPASDKEIAVTGAPSGTPKIYRTTTNNEGKFWLSGVVEGQMNVTVAAPKYRGLTIVNVDPDRISLSLVPNDVNLKRVKLNGMVETVMGKPATLALVNPSFVAGDAVAVGTVTDKDGEFDLDGVPIGTRTVVAAVSDAGGNVTSFGLAGDVKADPKEKQPLPVVITLKLVSEPIKLRGTVTPLAGFTPQSLHVYMTLNDKGEEVLVTTVPFSTKAKTFDVSLPPLPNEDASYHLEAVASDKKGNLAYHHLLGVREAGNDLQIAFMGPPERTGNAVRRDDKDDKMLIPTFSWTSVPDTSYYHLVLMEGDDQTLWEAWTPYNSVSYPLTFGPERVRNSVEYHWTVTAVKGQPPAAGTTASAPPANGKLRYSMLKTPWTDASSVAARSVLITKKDLDKLNKEEAEK